MKKKQWSVKFAHCVICKKTHHQHTAFGKCKMCYERERYISGTNPLYFDGNCARLMREYPDITEQIRKKIMEE
jgi:hypothetical protein